MLSTFSRFTRGLDQVHLRFWDYCHRHQNGYRNVLSLFLVSNAMLRYAKQAELSSFQDQEAVLVAIPQLSRME